MWFAISLNMTWSVIRPAVDLYIEAINSSFLQSLFCHERTPIVDFGHPGLLHEQQSMSLGGELPKQNPSLQVYFEQLQWFAFICRITLEVVVSDQTRYERWDNNLWVYFSTCPKITLQLRVACPMDSTLHFVWFQCSMIYRWLCGVGVAESSIQAYTKETAPFEKKSCKFMRYLAHTLLTLDLK